MTGTQPISPFRWTSLPGDLEFLESGLLPAGFVAGGMACGIKADGSPDLGMVACREEGVTSAIVLTTNAAAAAPVRICREELDQSSTRAAVVTSGNANCATGEHGLDVARAIRDAAAAGLGLEPGQVAIAQTGVIGVQLDPGPVEVGIGDLSNDLEPDGSDRFAEAILTTDLGRKTVALRSGGVTVTAQAKGAGMIEPGLATMLCFIQTDAVVDQPESALRDAVGDSFNRISVDGQMSTNDTVLLQASGTSGSPLPEGLLEATTLELALAIVADGEGATRVCRIDVRNAASDDEADRVARAIANSPLVKTALFGRDPNWGRVLQAAGAALPGEDLSGLGEQSVLADELAGNGEQVEVAIDLERGTSASHAYFSDLTPRYIEINAEYTT